VHVRPLPRNPGAQVQVRVPGPVGEQSAFASQPPLLVAHAFTGMQLVPLASGVYPVLHAQPVPFPEEFGLQRQEREEPVSTQAPSTEQPTPPPHVPPVHCSPEMHPSPSLHALPSGSFAYAQLQLVVNTWDEI